MTLTEMLRVRLRPDQRSTLEQIARTRGTTISAELRRAVDLLSK